MMSSTPTGADRSHWIADLRWAREAQQQRSKRTQAALLDAVEAELQVSTVDELSVDDIAKRAGVSVGAVYHHFTNKQALIYAMLDRLTDEWIATTDDATDPERWAEAKLLDVVRGFAEYSLLRLRETEGVARARLQLALADPAIAAQEEKAHVYMTERVIDLMWARRSEIGRDDPREAINFVVDQVTAMVRFRVSHAGARVVVETDQQFLDGVVESACAHLRVDMA